MYKLRDVRDKKTLLGGYFYASEISRVAGDQDSEKEEEQDTFAAASGGSDSE